MFLEARTVSQYQVDGQLNLTYEIVDSCVSQLTRISISAANFGREANRSATIHNIAACTAISHFYRENQGFASGAIYKHLSKEINDPNLVKQKINAMMNLLNPTINNQSATDFMLTHHLASMKEKEGNDKLLKLIGSCLKQLPSLKVKDS